MKNKIGAFLKLIRWQELFFVAFTMFSFHYGIVTPMFDYFSLTPAVGKPELILIILSSLFIFAGGNVINDYFDRKTDFINRPESVIVIFKIKRRQAIFYHLVFSILGIILGIIVSFMIRKPILSLFYILTVIYLWIYSVRLKKDLIINNISVAIFISLIAVIIGVNEYFAFEKSITEWNEINIRPVKLSVQIIFGYGIFAFIINLIREILKDCRDIKGDSLTGVNTIPVIWGKKKANVVVFILSLLFIGLVTVGWEVYLSKLIFFKNFIFADFYIYSMIVFPAAILFSSSLFGEKPKKYLTLIRLTEFVMFTGLFFCFIIRFALYEKI